MRTAQVQGKTILSAEVPHHTAQPNFYYIYNMYWIIECFLQNEIGLSTKHFTHHRHTGEATVCRAVREVIWHNHFANEGTITGPEQANKDKLFTFY